MTNLQKAVYDQLGFTDDYDNEELKDKLSDIANSSADAGWIGFTYYNETVKFAEDNREDIKALVFTLADELGEEPLALVRSFGVFRNYSEQAKRNLSHVIATYLYGGKMDEDHEDYTALMNVMAWFALEEVARIEE